MNRDRLAKLLPRLASDHDGEVIATVAAIRRTLEADGADLHDLAQSIGVGASTSNNHDRLFAAMFNAMERSLRLEKEAAALREELKELPALRAKLAAASKPKRTRSDAASWQSRCRDAMRDRDEIGEQLRRSTDEVMRLRSELAEVMGRPRGTLPPSWDRCSPIERVAVLEAWADDAGMPATDRRWAARLAAALEERAPVDPRDVRRFNALLRSRPAQN